MMERTIKNVIKRKMDDVAKHLPEELKKTFLDNVIVTGGCITSMLLGEEVNDYDIYMRDQKSLLELAEHFASKANKELGVNDNDISRVRVVGMNKELQLKTFDNDIIEPSDRLYMFIQSDGVMKLKKDEDDKYKPIFISSNAITLQNKVQLVVRFYGEPEEIHKNYDFEHTKAYYDYKYNNISIPKKAYECVLNKTLKYTGSLYPICSLFRIKKFIKRGWTINAGQIFKMAYQVSELDLNSTDVLRDQLTGVDSAYFSMLISRLAKKENVDRTMVMKEIEKIFG